MADAKKNDAPEKDVAQKEAATPQDSKKTETKKAAAKSSSAKSSEKSPAKAKAKAKNKTVEPHLYDVLRSPMITEKATMAMTENKLAFKVAMSSTKADIKEAVEGIYGVTVTAVNTSVAKGKNKRFRGVKGTRIDTKKATVTLKEGDSVDIMTGV